MSEFDGKFVSTFGEAEPKSYSDATLQGLAADGGLYYFDQAPHPGDDYLASLAGLPHHQLFHKVNSLFITGIPAVDQAVLAANAFDKEYPGLEAGQLAPIRNIESQVYVQRLGGLETGAFKDHAANPVMQFINYLTDKSGQYFEGAGATSGDTAPSMEAAAKGLERIFALFLSPDYDLGYGTTKEQHHQMGALSGGNVVNIALPLRFTGCQNIIIALKKLPEFSSLGAFNSINIARKVAQTAYKVSGYLQVIEQEGLEFGHPVDVVVPSGNLGNGVATLMAKEMGVPFGKITFATNENDFIHELVQDGRYRIRTETEGVTTTSTSMDIDYANNAQHLIYRALGNDPEKTRRFMELAKRPEGVDFAEFGIANDILKTKFNLDSVRSDDTDRQFTTQHVYDISRKQDIIDPHTADALHGAYIKKQSGIPIYAESTADPFKFGDAIDRYIGVRPNIPEHHRIFMARADTNPEAFIKPEPGEDPLEFVANVLRDHRRRRAAVQS